MGSSTAREVESSFHMDFPAMDQLHMLTEEELLKLTKSNTRKNVGGYKRRLTSQLERVCRRLDNLVIDAKLAERISLEALPVVDPSAEQDEVEIKSDFSTPKNNHENIDTCPNEENITNNYQDKSVDSEPQQDESMDFSTLFSDNEDSLEIEAASQSSLFAPSSISTISGVPRSNRSVRISSAVTILDYTKNKRDREPSSISTQKRFEHPTRSGKNFRLRRALAENNTYNLRRKDIGNPRLNQNFRKPAEGSSTIDCLGMLAPSPRRSSEELRRARSTSFMNAVELSSPVSPYGNRVKNLKGGDAQQKDVFDVHNNGGNV